MPDEKDIAIVAAKQEMVNPNALEKVAEGISALPKKEDLALVVSAKDLRSVLPVKFYDGASTLATSAEERLLIDEFRDVPNDQIEIRPDDGMIYCTHIHYRRALTQIFGTEWVMMPGSPIAREDDGDKVSIAQRWVLIVRGCYVGEAVGVGVFWKNNAKMNLSDAAEAAQSEALRRICAKSALGIGSNCWDRRFANRWRKENCVEVWVTTIKGKKQLWRRVDDDPLDGEVPPAKEKPNAEIYRKRDNPAPQGGANTPSQSGDTTSGVRSAGSAKTVHGGDRDRIGEVLDESTPEEGPAPEWIEGEVVEPEVAKHAQVPAPTPAPQVPKAALVTETNFRFAVQRFRVNKMVEGDSCGLAITFLSDKAGLALPANTAGKKQIEVLRSMFLTMPAEDFQGKFVPAINAYRAKGE